MLLFVWLQPGLPISFVQNSVVFAQENQVTQEENNEKESLVDEPEEVLKDDVKEENTDDETNQQSDSLSNNEDVDIVKEETPENESYKDIMEDVAQEDVEIIEEDSVEGTQDEEINDTDTTVSEGEAIDEDNTNTIQSASDQEENGSESNQEYKQTALGSIVVLHNEQGFVNVRTDASNDAEIVTKVTPDEKYEYTDEKYDWYEIILNNTETGWVSGVYVSLDTDGKDDTPEETENATAENQDEQEDGTDSISDSESSEESDGSEKTTNDDEDTQDEEQTNSYDEDSDNKPDVLFSVEIINLDEGETLALREDSSTESGTIATIPVGEVLPVFEISGDTEWHRTYIDEVEGWIFAEYTKHINTLQEDLLGIEGLSGELRILDEKKFALVLTERDLPKHNQGESINQMAVLETLTKAITTSEEVLAEKQEDKDKGFLKKIFTSSISDLSEVVTDDPEEIIEAVVADIVEEKRDFASFFSVQITPKVGGKAITLDPEDDYSFIAGSVVLVFEPNLVLDPGTYTITVKIVNPITGKTETITQDLNWGVLAMNTNQDAYLVNDTATIDFGMIDETGAVVCDGALDLDITKPDGSTATLSTASGDIVVSETCGELTNDIPADYTTTYAFTQEGIYTLALDAVNANGAYSDVTFGRLEKTVVVGAVFSDAAISRNMNTRLFPGKDADVSIALDFSSDFVGEIYDVVPLEFELKNIGQGGAEDISESGEHKVIVWDVTASAGESVTLSYIYNAPDVSPYFYTVGPLQSADGSIVEAQVWQLANDASPSLAYVSPGAFDINSAVFVDAFSLAAQETSPNGMAFSTDGTKMFVVGIAGDDVNEYTLSTAFDVSTASFVDAFSVAAQETSPRAVAFSADGTKMFVIGNTGDDVNEYTLTTAWDVSTASFVDAFSIAAQESVPLGMAFSTDGTKMFVVGSSGDDVNEYTLSTAFDVSTASFVDAFSVVAQELVPHGIAFSTDGTKMFVVGSSGDDVNEYTLSTAFDVSTASFVGIFSVSAQDLNPSAIAFSADGTKMFILGDSGNDVNEYMLTSVGDYPENVANDGSINNSSPLAIFLSGDTFQDTDTDNLLDVGSEVTINNVPAGLTPVMTLSDNDTRVTLTFTGNATDHTSADNVAELTFVFDDTAFTLGDATNVGNSGDGGAYSSNVGIDFIDAPGRVSSGLELWLKADSGTSCTTDGCTLATWADQSGNSNNGTAAGTPSYENVSTDLINSNPTVRYEDAADLHSVARQYKCSKQYHVCGW